MEIDIPDIEAEQIRQRLADIEGMRVKLSSRVRELEEELQSTRVRLHQHEGAVTALQDLLKGLNETT